MAVMALSGCQEPTPEPTPAPTLTLSTEAISVQYEAAEVLVSVNAGGDWGVYPADKSWVSVCNGGFDRTVFKQIGNKTSEHQISVRSCSAEFSVSCHFQVPPSTLILIPHPA